MVRVVFDPHQSPIWFKALGLRVGPWQHVEMLQEIIKKRPQKGLITYISYAQDILFLFQAIFNEKSVMYLQTTTIDHVSFYKPNSVPQLVRRLFYADR